MKAADFIYRSGGAFETIPDHMCQGLDDYIERHWKPGGFLLAVLSNDLREACALADYINIKALPVFVAYLHSEAPSACWGSPERVEAWLAARRPAEEKEED